MNRRHFLGSLFASIVGVATADIPTLLWQPSPLLSAPMLEPGALVGLDQMTHYLVDKLTRAGLHGEVLDAGGEVSLGQRGVTHQLGVDFEGPRDLDKYGLDAQRYLDPVAQHLINQCQRIGVTKFGALPIPPGIECGSRMTHLASGVSVRGLSQYDLRVGTRVRFDLAVG